LYIYVLFDRDQWRALVNKDFHKRQGISSLVERLSASPEGLRSVELVS